MEGGGTVLFEDIILHSLGEIVENNKELGKGPRFAGHPQNTSLEFHYMRSEVYTAVRVQILVFWVVTPFRHEGG